MRELLILLLLAAVSNGESKISCKNMQGKDVDWFVALKMPKKEDVNKGFSFVYFDSSQDGWKWSRDLINSTNSAIGATVNQLYIDDKKGDLLKLAYNDDGPENREEGSGRGHSKGVLVSTKEGGFWLVHSVPRFPPPKKYDYPETGAKYAQSFICLTLDAGTLMEISQYMRWSQVTPFVAQVPEAHRLIAPYLTDVANKQSLGRSDTNYVTIHGFETAGHTKVMALAKHKKFGKDLWHDLIAPFWKTPMAVETWRNGAAKNVGTQCDTTGPNVYDITSVKLLEKSYSSSRDHSKWGVSMDKKKPVVCIGDVNRQESQFKRGGGAVCIRDMKLWKTVRESVGTYLDCGEAPPTKAPKKKSKSNKIE